MTPRCLGEPGVSPKRNEHSEQTMSRNLRAFTLLELMVTISLVAVLLTLVIVPLHRVRQSANRTNSLNALRQMVLAYSAYSTDHRYQLMPGYIDESLFEPNKIFEDLTVELPSGEALDRLDAQAYVWRLAPYLDDVWKTMYVDYRSKALLSELEVEYLDGTYGPGTIDSDQLGISLVPSFGMNSIFVGGDSFHGGTGTDVTDRNPWTGSEEKLAATRFSEVKNPARLIVFGTAALANRTAFSGNPDTDVVYDSEERLGYVELRPPFTAFDDENDNGVLDPGETWTEMSRQWKASIIKVFRTPTGDYTGPTGLTGLPVSRWGANRLPVANLDGSTRIEETSTLAWDMRRWSPFQIGLPGTPTGQPP